MRTHEIAWHPADRLILVKPVGFWSVADFDRYKADMLGLIGRVGSPFDILTDMSERVPQAQAVANLLDAFAVDLVGLGLRRFVVVGATPLSGMQARRVAKAATPYFVSSVAEGRAWLRLAPHG